MINKLFGMIWFKLIISMFRTEMKILIAVHRRQSVYLTSKNWLKLNVLFVSIYSRCLSLVRLIFHNDFNLRNMCMFVIAKVKNYSAVFIVQTFEIRKLFRREIIFCASFDSINHR